MPGYKPIRIDDDKSSKAKNQSESGKRVPLYPFIFIVAGCIGFAALSSYVRFSQPGARADFVESESSNPKFNLYDVIQDGPNLKLAKVDGTSVPLEENPANSLENGPSSDFEIDENFNSNFQAYEEQIRGNFEQIKPEISPQIETSEVPAQKSDMEIMNELKKKVFDYTGNFQNFQTGRYLMPDVMGGDSENATPTAPPTDSAMDQSEDATEDSDQSEEATEDSDQSETTSEFDDHSVPSYLQGYGSSFVYNQPQPSVPAQNQAATYSETNDQLDSSYSNDQLDSGSGDSEGSGSYYQPNPTHQPNTPPAVSSLSCWRCENALTWGECASSGHLEHCEESANSCQLTVRKRDGKYESITTGCKQKEACENNKSNNFVSEVNYQNNQCRPSTDNGPSVCRQCCYSNNCNYNLDFFDIQGWRQQLL